MALSMALSLACLAGLAHAGSAPKKGQPPQALSAPVHVDLDALPLAQRAGALAQALGRSRRLLIGVGSADTATLMGQGLNVDIYQQYLNGVGKDSWLSWNSPSGAYVDIVAEHADLVGAVPMYTLYQMAARGDGNLSGLTDPRLHGPLLAAGAPAV